MNKFIEFNLNHSVKTSAKAIGAMKFSQIVEMSEEEFEGQLEKIENDRLFKLLKASGAVKLIEFPNARYVSRIYAGYGFKLSACNLPDLIDGKGDLAVLMRKIGLGKFEEYFLKDALIGDSERAKKCNISLEDSIRLREYLNRAFIQAEFETSMESSVSKVFSSVAGIQIENKKPALAFFHREIWKGRYKIDKEKLSEILKDFPKNEQNEIENLLKRIDLSDTRKSTLYRLLELLIKIQSDYLLSGELINRRPLSQKEISKKLEIHPSVLNRLISNKSIQMP